MSTMVLLVMVSVAPAGAWVEIQYKALCPDLIKSLPLWERGLKSLQHCLWRLQPGSLPLRERGLKLCGDCNEQMQVCVASLAEIGLKQIYTTRGATRK